VVCPVVNGAAGPERVFEVTLEALHQTIGLQMVACCLGLLDVEQVSQGGPQGEGERGTAVLMNDRRDAESAHPPLKQSICAVYCCGGGDRDRLGPAGSFVHDNK
jgi:hypothetical protein